jgi:hypothetical protein
MQVFQGLSANDRKSMETRILEAMRQAMHSVRAHSVGGVTIAMVIPKAHPGWKADALTWAEGQGITNQGRARSTNIAPFEEDGLLFRSRSEIYLYHALKKSGVTVAPLPVFVRGGSEYRRLEPDFVLVNRGIMMVVEVDGDAFHPEAPVDAHERLAVLSREGVHTERVRAEDCASDEAANACAKKLIGILEKLASNR